MKSRKAMNPNVTFRDSWNLIPGPLSSMVPMFGLDVQDKPFFPHLANRPENYGRQILPSKSDYLADGMNPERRKEFDRWFEQNKNVPFLLDEALARSVFYFLFEYKIILAIAKMMSIFSWPG